MNADAVHMANARAARGRRVWFVDAASPRTRHLVDEIEHTAVSGLTCVLLRP